MINIKRALFQIIRSRIWALNKAEEIVRARESSQGKQIVKTSDTNARTVSLAGEIVFQQKVGGSDIGTFMGSCSSLSLPAGKGGAAHSP